ncbi:MAG: hypothetical protein GX458_13150, partial [Phyllobacteriaceae bacterium]|nr:hypothetical protein [Phyllobacteriaceae bacterium]
MARLPTLVSIIADRDNREHTTIDQMARFIREAGFISTTKRGKGASEMTAKDAANLLIGVTATESPKNAAIEVARKSTFRRHTWPRYPEIPAPFARIEAAETFAEAMEALIADTNAIEAWFGEYIDVAFPDFDEQKKSYAKEDFLFAGGVDIVFRRASTEIIVFKNSQNGRLVEYDFKYVTNSDLFMK